MASYKAALRALFSSRSPGIRSGLILFAILAGCLGIQRVFDRPPSDSVISPQEAGGARDPLLDSNRALELYSRLPLAFEANRGQADSSVKFLTRGKNHALFLTDKEAVLVLQPEVPDPGANTGAPQAVQASREPAVLRLGWAGASPNAAVTPLEPLPGKTHYYRDETSVEDISSYARVTYAGLYPGIDLVYYGRQNQLEFDLVVNPEADPAAIRLKVGGARRRHIDAAGNLILETSSGDVELRAPEAYQYDNGGRTPVPSRYRMHGLQEIGFEVGSYDTNKPLVIDPVIAYSSFIGGNSQDEPRGVVLDDINRNIHIVGFTFSTNFPHTPATNPPFQAGPGGVFDAFVMKLDASGSTRIFSTYFGGSQTDIGGGIDADQSGNTYIAGLTQSPDLVTRNAVQPAFGGGTDAFAAKFGPTGTLLFSTYIGGPGEENSRSIVVEGNSTFVAGSTNSGSWRTPVNQIGPRGGGDIWVARLESSGSGLTYLTMLGGTGSDSVNGIAVSGSIASVVGVTQSSDFPVASASQGSRAGGTDAFVASLNSSGAGLVFSTYLGGSATDAGSAIAVERGEGNLVVTGNTASRNEFADPFPLVNAFQPYYGGGESDAFVAKFSESGALRFSTFLGGCQNDFGNAIAVDERSGGSASGANYFSSTYVAGSTSSVNFPLSAPIRSSFSGGPLDAFVTRLNVQGTVVFSTYLGGSQNDHGAGIASNFTQTAAVVGTTASADFTTTTDALQRNLVVPGDVGDGFLTRLTTDNLPGEMLPPFAAPGVWTRMIRADSNANGVPDPDDETINVAKTSAGQDLNLRFISPRWNPCDPKTSEVTLSKSSPSLATFDTVTRRKDHTRRRVTTTGTLVAATSGAQSQSTMLGGLRFLEAGQRAGAVNVRDETVVKATGAAVLKSGSVSATDANGDGLADAFTVQRTGQPAITVSPVYFDVNGDKKADFISMPWALSHLLGIAGDRIPDPQVFLPLGDTNGDGTPDSPAFDFDNNNQPDSEFPLMPLVSGPALATGHKLYFAQFGDGRAGSARIYSQITIVNLEDQEASVTINIRDDSGQPLTIDLNGEVVTGEKSATIPAGGVRFFKTDGEGPITTGSVIVTSNRRVSGVILFGGSIGLAGVGSSQEMTGGFLAPMELNAAEGTSTGIALQNLDEQPLSVTLQLFNSEGLAISDAAPPSIPALGHVARFLNEFSWSPPVDFANFSGVLKATTAGRVAATVIQVRPGEFATQPAAALLQGPAQTRRQAQSLYFAHFGKGSAGGVQLFSQIILVGLTQLQTEATVDIRDDAGQPLTVELNGQTFVGRAEVTIPPGGIRILRAGTQGALIGGSVTVNSNAPLAGVVLFGGNIGVAGVGASEPASQSLVAPVEVNAADGIDTGIALMNLGKAEASIEVRLFDVEGRLISRATLPAGSLRPLGHFARFLNQLPWDTPVNFSSFRGKVRINTISPVAATVLQTQAGQFATLPVTPQ